MRAFPLALLLLFAPTYALAEPLSGKDVTMLRAMSQRYVEGWLKNDRAAVMSVFARDAVFIPHDGVKPKIGHDAIDAFWFPGGKAVGRVPDYTQTVSEIKGQDGHATIYGRFDLTYEAADKRYNWIGNFLIVARKQDGRWLFTHMMASDEDPKIEAIVPGK